MRKPRSLVIQAPDLDAMRALGAALAHQIEAIDAPLVLSLAGELGAGKTTLVGGVLHALGYAGHVRSPTYTLIEPYELAGRSIYHLDLYRLADPLEVEPLALRDLLQPRSVLLIEWPDRAGEALPPVDAAISVAYVALGRVLTIRALSQSGERILRSLPSGDELHGDVTEP